MVYKYLYYHGFGFFPVLSKKSPGTWNSILLSWGEGRGNLTAAADRGFSDSPAARLGGDPPRTAGGRQHHSGRSENRSSAGELLLCSAKVELIKDIVRRKTLKNKWKLTDYPAAQTPDPRREETGRDVRARAPTRAAADDVSELVGGRVPPGDGSGGGSREPRVSHVWSWAGREGRRQTGERRGARGGGRQGQNGTGQDWTGQVRGGAARPEIEPGRWRLRPPPPPDRCARSN